jgi:hypothetical protein
MVVNHVPRAVLHKATNLRGAAPVLAYSAFTGAMQPSSDASFLPVWRDVNCTKTDGTRRCRPPGILRESADSRW